jgi:hypothetical protein
LRQRTRARAHALVGWLSGRLDLSVRPCGRARGVAGVGVAYQATPIKDRTAPELLKAFKVMEQELVARGLRPKLMRLDNEASTLLKDYLYHQDIAFQLVPPYGQRRNSVEQAIRSFKDHLISGLCSTDKSLPMHLWDIILPQAVITLNMLRTSRINPKLSAATHLFGQYDFNRAPLCTPWNKNHCS